jgi:polyhydroxyalkanoate synthesis regulator phasin
MANLTVGLLIAGLSAVGLSGITYLNSDDASLGADVVILGDRRRAAPGAIVQLNPSSADKYPQKGLTRPGSTFSGTLQYVDRTNPKALMIQVSNTVRARRFNDLYKPEDFILVQQTKLQNSGGIKIQNGFASVGAQVKYRQTTVSDSVSPKSLANPFYNSVGVVESIDPETSKISVKATALKDVNITYTQDYDATELVFVSLPYDDESRGISNDYGFINVGSRVSLTLKKLSKYQQDSTGIVEKTTKLFTNPFTNNPVNSPISVGQKSSQLFLASREYDKIGVVTRIGQSRNGTSMAIVKCKQVDKNNYIDQAYYIEDLQVVGSDGIPPNTVFILGGIAENGVKVKLRDEKKEESAGKSLVRPTYGLVGSVEDVDPNAQDNLKVQVRSVGSNNGEEASDWYNAEHLEIVDMPKDEGIPIFGGFASVGSVVEVMVDARGLKCLGKPEIGNVGVVMGIDPSASGGETLNIKCGRDLQTNTKVSNWYKPTDVKIYIKPDISGTEQERKEIQLIKKRTELLTEQRRVVTPAESEQKKTNIATLKADIRKLEEEIEAEKKKGTTVEGMRELYTRLMEELVKFRRNTAAIDQEYSVAKLDTTCNITDVSTETLLRAESEGILTKYYDPATILDIIQPNPLPAGEVAYIADEPSNDPNELQVLEDAARTAIEAYNSNKTPHRKQTADAALEAVKRFKEGRQYQAPQTNSQKTYVKKRDELVAALRVLVPGPPTYDINLADPTFTNFPAIAALRLAPPAAGGAVTRISMYQAYLDIVYQVELAKNTNPADPTNGIASLNTFINLAGCQLAIDAVRAQGGVPLADIYPADSLVRIAGEALATTAAAATLAIAAAAAAGAPPAAAAEAAAAQSTCKLAAYELLVTVVESSNLTIKDRFITKLYWEKKYKDSTTKLDGTGSTDPFGNFIRKFDENDVYLRKLNEAGDAFEQSLNPTPDTADAANFRKLKNAFAEFDSARRSIFDEVHGEITQLEKEIKRMIEYKKQQIAILYTANSEMVKAQTKYSEVIKKEKFADVLLMNAFIKRKQEADRILTIVKPASGDPNVQQQQQNPGRKNRRGRGDAQYGGAISSTEREINHYLAKLFTNYVRINHYRSIIRQKSEYNTAKELFEDNNSQKTIDIYRQLIPKLTQIFQASAGNRFLYDIVPAGGPIARVGIVQPRLARPAGRPPQAAAPGPRQQTIQDRQNIARIAANTVRVAVVAEPVLANMVGVANAAAAQANQNAAAGANTAGALIGPAQAAQISTAAANRMVAATQTAVAAAGATAATVTQAVNAEMGRIVAAQQGGEYTSVSRRKTRRLTRY